MSRIFAPIIPGEDMVSGAQVVDGSLKFNKDKSQRLQFTPSTSGNRRTWTISYWYKNTNFANTGRQFQAGTSDPDFFLLGYHSLGYIQCTEWSTNWFRTGALLRDTGWYHIVLAWDSTQSTNTERWKFYINGVRQNSWTDSGLQLNYPSQNAEQAVNKASVVHQLGSNTANSQYTDGHMSQVYFVDGQQLDASYFGYTDALTNTWRPKKLDGFGNTAPNEVGTTWSDSLTAPVSGFTATSSAFQAFDGNLTSLAATSNAVGANLLFSKTITGVTSLRVYADHSTSYRMRLNGGTWYSDSTLGATANASWRDLTSIIPGGGTITSIEADTDGANNGVNWSAIEVNGTILLNNAGWGKNGFYLPLDGNTPIGQDQSGKGNNWTPVNFGGSNTLEKATGAFPILNTVSGGNVATAGVRTDSNSSNLVLALPLVGNANDVSNQINSGSTTKTTTVTGAVADSTTSNFYGGSFNFDGTDDNITTNTSTDFQLGTSDFTVECWFYHDTMLNGDQLVNFQGTSGSNFSPSLFYTDNTGPANVYIYLSSNGSTFDIANSQNIGQVTTGTWNHYALCRSGNTFYGFINGVLGSTWTSSSSIYQYANQITLCARAGYYTDGKMQDFRFYKGVAKYTSNFIPASTVPDILPDTPSGVSGSSKLTKVTDGAVSFDGGDNTNLSIADSTDFDHASAFTWEGYFYLKSYDSSGSSIVRHENDGLDWYINTSGNIVFNQNTSTNIVSSGNGVMTLNKWVHIAVSHTGSVCKMFVDGVEKASATTSTVPDNVSGILYIGETGDNNNYQWNGFISNLRFVNGTALYTSDFTPPTAPLTNVTNTKLLCCQSTTTAASAAVYPANSDWQPSGFTYWTDGMTDTWNSSGTSTSGSDDYIPTALPTSGKYYWETIVNDPSAIREFGIATGASGVGASYTNNIFGFYFNSLAVPPNPPLFLAYNSSGVDRADSITHGGSTGTSWVNGDILMWAWDADNDKIWFGYNGTWYASGDPANGTNPAISGEDLSASTWYFKIGYDPQGNLDLTNRTSTSQTSYIPTANGNASATNFNPFTTDINTVRGQESGYATWNPLSKYSDNFGATVSTVYDGNLSIDFLSGTNAQDLYRATLPVSSGKHYCEWTCKNSPAANNTAFIMGIQDVRNNKNWLSETGAYAISTGTIQQLWSNGTQTNYWWTGDQSAGDVFGFALDLDNSNIKFYHNGVQIGSTVSIPSGQTYAFAIQPYQWQAAAQGTVNFGQKPFKFPPPDGFQPLNASTVRPSTVIARPDQYVGVSTWTGDGTGDRTIGGFSFKPDFVWSKERSGTDHHLLYDCIRGGGNSNSLSSSLTASEGAVTNTGAYGYINSFTSDGFETLSGVTDNRHFNESSSTYVAWAWKAGGAPTADNVATSGAMTANSVSVDGVLQSAYTPSGSPTLYPTRMSIGTKQGFSIVRWTGTNEASKTIPHGLSQTPSFIIQKAVNDGTYAWNSWHQSLGTDYYIQLNTTSVQDNSVNVWPTAGITDSIITTSPSSPYVNNGINVGRNHIAYIWHDVPGLQKFGSYTGNSSTDGPFIELGFRPALVIVKIATGVNDSWRIYDSERNKFNLTNNRLLLDTSVIEGQSVGIDILSNGFKLRDGDAAGNGSGNTYIYAAWAEAPTFNLYGAQSNAR